MEKEYIILIISLVLIGVVVGIILFNFSGNESNDNIASTGSEATSKVPAPGNPDVEEMIVVPQDDSEMNSETFTVEMTSSGFSPKTLEISFGDSVTFVNEDTKRRWPASAVHPSHTIYPEFDSLKGISPGESYTFKFDRIGIWKYHDHLSSSTVGTIIVG